MNKRFTPNCKAGLLVGLFAMLAPAAIAAGPSAPTEEAVVLTGWLHVADNDMGNVLVEVEVDGQFIHAPVSANGRFSVALPRDAEAVLRFEKPGHLPKEVVVDTRHAELLNGAGKARRVKLAVVLDPVRFMGGLVYDGPVGSLGFDAGGGCVAVEHHRRIIPAKDRPTMVF